MNKLLFSGRCLNPETRGSARGGGSTGGSGDAEIHPVFICSLKKLSVFAFLIRDSVLELFSLSANGTVF